VSPIFKYDPHGTGGRNRTESTLEKTTGSAARVLGFCGGEAWGQRELDPKTERRIKVERGGCEGVRGASECEKARNNSSWLKGKKIEGQPSQGNKLTVGKEKGSRLKNKTIREEKKKKTHTFYDLPKPRPQNFLKKKCDGVMMISRGREGGSSWMTGSRVVRTYKEGTNGGLRGEM